MKKNKTNVIISPNIRIRLPDEFKVDQHSVIDDFSYFSTKLEVGKFCHIASNCTIAGGKDFKCTVGDYTSISSGVRVWCRSNDFTNDLVILETLGKDIGDKNIEGDVIIGKMCGIGSNSVIMPNNNIPDGTVIGALSFVPSNFKFKQWSVYGGIPIKFIKKRNKKNVLSQLKKLESYEK